MKYAKEVDDMETQDEGTRQIQKIVSYGFLPNLDLTVMSDEGCAGFFAR